MLANLEDVAASVESSFRLDHRALSDYSKYSEVCTPLNILLLRYGFKNYLSICKHQAEAEAPGVLLGRKTATTMVDED